jgi:hypothetical protein
MGAKPKRARAWFCGHKNCSASLPSPALELASALCHSKSLATKPASAAAMKDLISFTMITADDNVSQNL